MIKKINKIKNLGLVFLDYTWDSNLPAFKRSNLVYAWTGRGKTTLSRLFGAIGGTPIVNLEYEIEDDQNVKYRQDEQFPKNVRVFNQDYVQKNIEILENRANSISILLGEENKDLVVKIEADTKLLNGDASDPENPGKVS